MTYTVKTILVYTLFPEPIDGFGSNLVHLIGGMVVRSDWILFLDLIFKFTEGLILLKPCLSYSTLSPDLMDGISSNLVHYVFITLS